MSRISRSRRRRSGCGCWITSQLDDGEFARLVFDKIARLIGPLFTASLERAVAAGDAARVGQEPMNLFWFAHHTMLMAALSRLPAVPCLTYGDPADLERQTCEYILRGIGLNEAVIAAHLDREIVAGPDVRGTRQKVHEMTIATETPPAARSAPEKPRHRPVRMMRWFIIVGLLLALLVGGLVGFNAFRNHMIAQFFANNKPPPITVSVAEAKSEVVPNLLTAVGDLAAVHQVNVTSDVSGRITEIMFRPAPWSKAGAPLLQLYDAPEQADLANYKAQAKVAELSLDRAKQLAARQFGPQATVDSAQAAFDQANAGIARTQAVISQKLVRAPFDGVLGVRRVEVGQYLTAGTQIVTLTDLSQIYANFTVTEKDSGTLKVGQAVRVKVDAYPGRTFEGKITTIEPQISSDTRNIRVQAHARQSGPGAEARHVRHHHRGAAGQAGGDHRAGDRGRLHAVRRLRVT